MKFGIEGAAYLTRYPFLEGVARMARHGYSAVDYNYFIDTDTPFFTQEEIDFKNEIERHGDILRSFHIDPSQTHGPWRFPPRDNTQEDREERFSVMAKSIRGSAYLGAKYMVIHPLMPYGAESSEHSVEVWEMNLEFMYRLALYGKEWGITVCYENMPFFGHPIATPDEIVTFVRTINHPNFKVCLDTGHALVRGMQPADAVRIIGADLLATLHIHDNDGTADQHCLVGEGLMHFPAFVRALDEIGFHGVISLETMPDKKSILTQEERDLEEIAMLAYIKSFFK